MNLKFISLNVLSVNVLLSGFLIFGSMSAFAAGNDLDALLENVKKYGALESKETKNRENQFSSARNKQKSLLQQARVEYRKEKARSTSLKQLYKKNEQELASLKKRLHKKMGNLGELVGVARQFAGETIGEFENSIISSQFSNRKDFIKEIAKTKTLPSIKDLENLWFNIQQEMTESGKVATYKANIVSPSGEVHEKSVTRIGTFVAFSEDQFLKYIPDTQQLALLPEQPSGYTLPDPASMAGTSYVGVTIDPTRGTILGLLGEIPGLWERVQQGRFIAYVIIIIGIIGFGLAIERLTTLSKTYKKIVRQKLSTDIDTTSPLGRIINACKNCSLTNITALEKILDEAITKELPFLEKRLSTIKILAAISPLLGLLGTVTGIIETFQSITLFGTGDPRLMASGISQALVTTALGLIVAIPLILLHNMAMTKAKACAHVLEEQSAAILAGRLSRTNA